MGQTGFFWSDADDSRGSNGIYCVTRPQTDLRFIGKLGICACRERYDLVFCIINQYNCPLFARVLCSGSNLPLPVPVIMPLSAAPFDHRNITKNSIELERSDEKEYNTVNIFFNSRAVAGTFGYGIVPIIRRVVLRVLRVLQMAGTRRTCCWLRSTYTHAATVGLGVMVRLLPALIHMLALTTVAVAVSTQPQLYDVRVADNGKVGGSDVVLNIVPRRR